MGGGVSYLRGHWEKSQAQKLAALHAKCVLDGPRHRHLLHPQYIKYSQYTKLIHCIKVDLFLCLVH